MWIIVIALILITLFIIFKSAYSKSSILTIVICINDNKYGIQYKPVSAGISSEELVWLCVLIPARMLFKNTNIKELTSDPDRIKKSLSESQLIKESLYLLGNHDWQNESDIKQITNSKIEVSENRLNGERFRFSLYYLGKEVRSVLLPFSPCESHFHNMWLSILITSLNYMTDKEKQILKFTFNEMHKIYLQDNADTLEASHEIPRKALIKGLKSI